MSGQSRQIVIDSSVIVKWLSADNEEHLEQADQLLKDVQAGEKELVSSELAKFEVANALLKGKKLSFQQAKQPLTAFYLLPITFYQDTTDRSHKTYALAAKHNLTYYDAAFAAAAAELKAPLMTDNIKHQGRVKDVTVISLENYPSDL